MDALLILVIVVLTAIYGPGNEKINDYCRKAVAGETEETFDSRIDCWKQYKDYRDAIPSS